MNTERFNNTFRFVGQDVNLFEMAATFCGCESVEEFKAKAKHSPNSGFGDYTFTPEQGNWKVNVRYNGDEVASRVHVWRTDREDNEYTWHEGERNLLWVHNPYEGVDVLVHRNDDGWRYETWPDERGFNAVRSVEDVDLKDPWDLHEVFCVGGGLDDE